MHGNGWHWNKVWCLAPHPDDETIGCGGLLSRAYDEHAEVKVTVVSGDPSPQPHAGRTVSGDERMKEAAVAVELLGGSAERDLNFWFEHQKIEGWPSGRAYEYSYDLVALCERMIRGFQPDLILFPYPSHHQDHETVYRAAVAALRPVPGTVTCTATMLMYEYAFLSAHGDFPVKGSGAVYLPLRERDLSRKLLAFNAHQSQVQGREPMHLISPESLELLARMRGREVGVEAAEKFYLWRSVI